MKFIEELKTASDCGNFRMFYGLDAGPVTLSIQASGTHYSTPREVLDPPEYTKWELGILKNGKLVHPNAVHSTLEKFNELFESGNSPIAGYVPTETVQSLLDELRKLPK